MEAENQQNFDEIDRALNRAGAKRDSALAKEMRASIWSIAGNDMTTARDAKLDRFIGEQRANPRFKDSFITPPQSKERPQRHNLLRLTPEEFKDIAAGTIRVE